MKTFFSSVVGVAASLSFWLTTEAIPLVDGPSCGIAKTDESSFFSVVGVQGTGVHPRQELRELEKDKELWNIFLQAFAKFQAMNQDDKVSYFKVAGIHGAPFGEWDGATGEGMTGYCPHVSNMFGPWHRPYLALFEQILHDRAVEVAKEYPVGEARNRAMEIANRVRLPYWDWATDPKDSDEGCMPSNLRRPTATITFPNGTAGQIANPLYQYNFHPLKYEDFSALSEFQFKNWNQTIRFPLDGHSPNATSRNDEANARIGKQQPNNRDMLYKLLTIYQPFNQWSTKANGGTIGNIETLHDGLHNAFGLGNMGIVEVSAFDPVFWFHHCNMDRIIALYQHRYPDTWVEDSVQNKATYTMPKGSTQGAQSPLAPFHMNAKGDMWTSATSRNWTSFGYTYPELADNPSNETLTKIINTLYKPQTQGLNKNNTLTTVAQGVNDTAPDAIDWLAEVHMPTDILISYSVRAFLGEPDKDPKKWATDANYVGQIASMSSPRMESDVIVTGSIVLTDKLAEKYKAGELKSLEKDEVTAWLKENFHWRIQALDFTEIPRNNPPAGLNVTVFNVPVHLPHTDTEVPTWSGAFEYDPQINGNPPVYNGAGPGGVNTTLPEDQSAGSWNSTSGEWVWKNATDTDTEGSAEGEGDVATLTSLITQFVTVDPTADATSAPTSTPVSSAVSSVEDQASVSPTPSPQPQAGTRVIEVTSVVTQFATVIAK